VFKISLVLILLWGQLASAESLTRLVMKDGTVYTLKEPPQVSGNRLIFTTVDGRTLSAKQDDVQSIGAAPKPPPPAPTYMPQDSRALGAIARQDREREHKVAEVAPPPTHRPTVSPKKRSPAKAQTPVKTPTPRPKS
jgi:hypothetical protein